MRTYTELIKLPTFEERFEYLRLNGKIGEELFGYSRYLNQVFYQSGRWKRVRRKVIERDKACDLGIEGRDIAGIIYVHHIEPITLQMLINDDPILINADNLISTSRKTHEAITIGDPALLPFVPIERKPFDTCPWRQQHA